MALRATSNIVLSTAQKTLSAHHKPSGVSTLYKSMLRELPHVLQIYDIDIPVKVAARAIRYQFEKNKDVKDPRAINLLVARGYMDLEETIMQWRQAAHLIDIFDPVDLKDIKWRESLTLEDKIVLGIDPRFN